MGIGTFLRRFVLFGPTRASAHRRTRSHLPLGVVTCIATLATSCATQSHAAWTVTYLHPAGATRSFVQGVTNGEQVGNTTSGVNGRARANLWSDTAGSWVDLHPAEFTASFASAADGGQQVGAVVLGAIQTGDWRASLWTGTAASRIALHPAGSTISDAWGVHNGQQVGRAVTGGVSRASLWTGTAAS